MPIFGEFETVGEPVAVSREAGHTSTIWQARRASGQDETAYAIKCFSPRPRPAGSRTAAEALGVDRGLEFLEGIKQMEQARAAGGRNLARVYGIGKTEASEELGTNAEGAWYATDYHRSKSLQEWIVVKGGVDAAALRGVVTTVVQACLALKRTRGYSHGNLKASNILLVGPTRHLRSRPLVVTDPFPAGASHLDRLGSTDRQEAAELLREVVEARDLRGLGELILQLVETRRIRSASDYDFPVSSSPAWTKLGGKESKYWLDLCNKLLDPQLTLAKANLEALGREFQPAADMGGVAKKAGLAVAAVVVLGAVAWGGMAGWKAYQSRPKPVPPTPPVVTTPAPAPVKQPAPAPVPVPKPDPAANFVASWQAGSNALAKLNFGEAKDAFVKAVAEAGKLGKPQQASAGDGLACAEALLGVASRVTSGAWIELLSYGTAASEKQQRFPVAESSAWLGTQTALAQSNCTYQVTNSLAEAGRQLSQSDLASLAKALDQAAAANTNAIAFATALGGNQFKAESQAISQAIGTLRAANDSFQKGRRDSSRADLDTARSQLGNLTYEAAGGLKTRMLAEIASLITELNQKQEKPWNDFTETKAFIDARQSRKTNGVADADFLQVARDAFGGNPRLDATTIAMPRLLPKLQEASRAKELGALKTMLGASASYQEFLKWGSSLSNRYVSPSPTAISSFTNTVGLDGLRETQTTDTVLRGKSVDLKSRWESLKAGLLEYAVSREDTQTQINNLENGRKVVVGELTLAQQREADRLRQDQLYQTATEKRDAGDFDAALAICKTNTGRFATLSNEVFVWRAKLNEMSNSLASGTYADVLANTAYAERAPFTSIFGRARAGTNALATARGHLAGCEFDEARKVMVGYAQVPAFKEMWSQATNGLALLKELGALQSAANYPAILNRLRSESSACFTNYGARAAAYLDATNRFQAEEYDKAAALCGQHESYPGFKELLADIKAEQAALGGLKASLDAGEYEKFLNTYGVSKYKARTNFAGLNKVAVAENTQWQALLKATNNWDQANAAFGALPAELQRKPPFQEIRRWLDMNNPVAKLDAQLELYKVYFGVSKPSAKVVDPATGKSAERLSNVQMEHINYIRKLRSDYQALKQLTPEREAALKDIETKIIRAAGA